MPSETLMGLTDRVLARYGIVPAEAEADAPIDLADPADLDAIAERDRVESFRVVRALIFALVCSAPFWALVIHEFRAGVLR